MQQRGDADLPSPTIGIRLDAETQARLKLLGEKRDRSPHYLMKEAIEAFLTREEEIEAENALLEARWKEYELTGEAISHSDVKRWVEVLPDDA